MGCSLRKSNFDWLVAAKEEADADYSAAHAISPAESNFNVAKEFNTDGTVIMVSDNNGRGDFGSFFPRILPVQVKSGFTNNEQAIVGISSQSKTPISKDESIVTIMKPL